MLGYSSSPNLLTRDEHHLEDEDDQGNNEDNEDNNEDNEDNNEDDEDNNEDEDDSSLHCTPNRRCEQLLTGWKRGATSGDGEGEGEENENEIRHEPAMPTHMGFHTRVTCEYPYLHSAGTHVRNALSVQSTCAVMHLSAWSRMGLVKDRDVMEAARLPDVKGSEAELDIG
jgi:hypothetical protein